MFKGQDSRVRLETVSSGAEVAVDGPGALPRHVITHFF